MKNNLYVYIVVVIAFVLFAYTLSMVLNAASGLELCKKAGSLYGLPARFYNQTCYFELSEGYLIRQDKYEELLNPKK